MYGLSEARCWIKLYDNSACDYDYIGLTFLFVFSYMPSLCVGMATLVDCDVQESYERGARGWSTICLSTGN